jgi:hypothetical protein
MSDMSDEPCTFTPASTEWIKSHLDRMDHGAPPEPRGEDTDTESRSLAATSTVASSP